MTYEEAMKKALNTPLPKKSEKDKVKKTSFNYIKLSVGIVGFILSIIAIGVIFCTGFYFVTPMHERIWVLSYVAFVFFGSMFLVVNSSHNLRKKESREI